MKHKREKGVWVQFAHPGPAVYHRGLRQSFPVDVVQSFLAESWDEARRFVQQLKCEAAVGLRGRLLWWVQFPNRGR